MLFDFNHLLLLSENCLTISLLMFFLVSADFPLVSADFPLVSAMRIIHCIIT